MSPPVVRSASKACRTGCRAVLVLCVALLPAALGAQDASQASASPLHSIGEIGSERLPIVVSVVATIAVLGVLPAAVLLTTCFPRVLIIFSFLRRAVGTRELPPNFIVVGLALVTSGAVMLPIWKQAWSEASSSGGGGDSDTVTAALERASVPIKKFMLRHVVENDREALRLFYELSTRGEENVAEPRYPEDIDFFVVLPAFVVSEVEVAFRIGFLLFLPFVLIDILVSSVLVSLGMFMLPPTLISLPLKVLVFVLADGWTLLVTRLVAGIG